MIRISGSVDCLMFDTTKEDLKDLLRHAHEGP